MCLRLGKAKVEIGTGTKVKERKVVRIQARIQAKVVLKVEAKEKVEAKAEVETGKAEVEALEVSKAEEKATKGSKVATKVKAKERPKLQEFVITARSMDTLRPSVGRNRETWGTRLGM